MAGTKEQPITTDRQLRALKPEGKVYWKAVTSPHGGGLAIRVTPTGNRAWYYRFRINGKADSMNLGRYPSVGLQEARQAHGEAYGLLSQGINPKRHQRQQRAENRAAWTMQELFDAWLPVYSSTPTVQTRRPPSAETVELHAWRWKRYLKDPLGDFLVKSVTRKHVSSEIAGIAEKTRADARKCLSLLRLLFEFAEARGQVDDNPAAGVSPAKVGATLSQPRKRVLSLVELRLLWQEMEVSDLHPSVSAALKMLMLTGQRRGETVLMKWADIDLDARTWTIPAEDAKSHRGHTVYLSDLALDVLQARPRGEYVFEGRIEGHIDPGGPTKAVQRLRARLAEKHGVPSFTCHDLRRTVATGMAQHCGIQPHIVSRALNHAPESSLVGTYQHQSYADELRAAWQAWGEVIATRVAREPGNVVALRRAE
ncbi:site-specific integrase [uncultured Halomonas sp.]|uniref:tyrosine-type recombinase/integrase n=1 Tax=uncultured Halomonas sp. TaxID=173971 RepID=UPI0026214AC4|nr:site-specific integrase [uncultured Halomonas sp.]